MHRLYIYIYARKIYVAICRLLQETDIGTKHFDLFNWCIKWKTFKKDKMKKKKLDKIHKDLTAINDFFEALTHGFYLRQCGEDFHPK